jgi:TonB family protein
MPGRQMPLFLLVAGLLYGGPAFGQQTGYLIIGGIDNGPAAVRLNGAVRASLSTTEVTFELAAGRYWLEIERAGFSAYRDTVAVPAGDAVHIRPRLEPYRPQVVDGNERPGRNPGNPGPNAGRLRVVHIEPFAVPILTGTEKIGETPLTLAMPPGEHLLAIGNSMICLRLQPMESARLLLRAGRAEVLEGAVECAVTAALMAAEPIFTPFDIAPVILNPRDVQESIRKLYPRDLRQVTAESQVWVFIAADGTVAKALIYRSSGYPAFDDVALRVSRAARFQPGSRGGQAAAGWATLPIRFGRQY